ELDAEHGSGFEVAGRELAGARMDIRDESRIGAALAAVARDDLDAVLWMEARGSGKQLAQRGRWLVHGARDPWSSGSMRTTSLLDRARASQDGLRRGEGPHGVEDLWR